MASVLLRALRSGSNRIPFYRTAFFKPQPATRPTLSFFSKRFASAAATNTTVQAPVTKPIVGYWLYFNAGLVYSIVVVGGLTRLTESGLSITEWNVISGMKPPRSEQEWQEQFEKYKQFPEYKLYVPRALSLSESVVVLY